MTYSIDFRQNVLAYKEKHSLTFQQTSEHFDIAIRTLFRWSQQIEPCLTRNKPSTKIDIDSLEKDIAQRPDDYQWERAKRFGVSQPCIHYALKRIKISYKKNTNTSKSR